MDRSDPTATPRLLLEVVAHPAPEQDFQPRVHIRPMGRPGQQHEIEERLNDEGRWQARLDPGRYVVSYTADAHRTEHRPIELGATGLTVTFRPVAKGARRMRFAGRQLPCLAPAEDVVVFLQPGADEAAVERVLAVADEYRLAFDPRRTTDRGVIAAANRFARRDGEVADPEGPVARRRPLEPPPLAALPDVTMSRHASPVVALRSPDPVTAQRAIGPLRDLVDVAAAGVSLGTDPDLPAVRRPVIDLRLAPGVELHELRTALLDATPLAEHMQLGRPSRTRRHAIDGLVHFRFPNDIDEQLDTLADAMLGTGLVLFAEARVAEHGRSLSADGNDWMRGRQWESDLLQVTNAHKRFGTHSVADGLTVAVIDAPTIHLDDEILSDDLFHKMALFDSAGRPGGHRLSHATGHAVHVAGLIAAADQPEEGSGMVGIAPGAHVTAFAIYPVVDIVEEAFRAAGGLADNRDVSAADVIAFPYQLGAFTTTMAVADASGNLAQGATDAGLDIDGSIFATLKHLAHRGRKGRGCLIVMSSGNTDQPIPTGNPVAGSPDALTCGASNLNPAIGDTPAIETAVDASCYGKGLDCVAPGYHANGQEGFTADAVGINGWPSAPLAKGKFKEVDAGKWYVKMPQDANGLVIPTGARFVVGEPSGSETQLWVTTSGAEVINGVVSFTAQRRIDAFTAPATGTPVLDTPIAFCDLRRARVAAQPATRQIWDGSLAISVKVDKKFTPRSFVRLVRASQPAKQRIMRVRDWGTDGGQPALWLTPTRWKSYINAHYADLEVWESATSHYDGFGQTSAAGALCAGVGALVLAANARLTATEARHIIQSTAKHIPLDVSGQPVSDWHARLGHGRIDADAAVAAALAYDHPRDLHFVSTPSSPGDHSPESEDIWVRRIGYGAPGTTGELPTLLTSPSGLDTTSEALDASGGHVCVRVHNRAPAASAGAGAASLPARVRLYAIATAKPHGTRFQWPEHWNANPRTPTIVTGRSHLIDDVPLPAGIAPGDSRIVQVRWPEWAKPTPSLNWHVLVEVTPHDGPHVGTGIGTNDNLARRLVKFI